MLQKKADNTTPTIQAVVSIRLLGGDRVSSVFRQAAARVRTPRFSLEIVERRQCEVQPAAQAAKPQGPFRPRSSHRANPRKCVSIES